MQEDYNISFQSCFFSTSIMIMTYLLLQAWKLASGATAKKLFVQTMCSCQKMTLIIASTFYTPFLYSGLTQYAHSHLNKINEKSKLIPLVFQIGLVRCTVLTVPQLSAVFRY